VHVATENKLVSLTSFLQKSFAAEAPDGWQSSPERHLLPSTLEDELGFSPRVDILLENRALRKRIWIEFEISRADPAANHLKFAVGHLFHPAFAEDTFLSMVSNHVARGRANLGASTILLMRNLGISAFQTALLPNFKAPAIKELNHLPVVELQERGINVTEEIQRAFAVTAPAFSLKDDEVYYAANEFEVSRNAKQWNDETINDSGAALWGKRTVRYFVFDRTTGLFAPSKFCAFLPVSRQKTASMAETRIPVSPMTLAHYSALDQSALRFDGGNAQKHLQRRLGYSARRLADSPGRAQFQTWLSRHSNHIRVHPDGPIILVAASLR
jgi:hypothetical protein